MIFPPVGKNFPTSPTVHRYTLWLALWSWHVGFVLTPVVDAPPRSLAGLALGAVPHVAILFFTVLVVWTAQPSSSQYLTLHCTPPY